MQYVHPEVWQTITTDYKYNRLDKVRKRLSDIVKSYLCDIICEHLTFRGETYTTSIRMSQFGDDTNLSAILLIPKLRHMLDNLITEYTKLVSDNIHSEISFYIDTEKQILTFKVNYA
jgi:hypothetical protein